MSIRMSRGLTHHGPTTIVPPIGPSQDGTTSDGRFPPFDARVSKEFCVDAVTLTSDRPSEGFGARPKGDVEALARLAQADMAAVDALIIDRMQSDVPVIPLLAEHIVAAGGKRMRPLITVAAARFSRVL